MLSFVETSLGWRLYPHTWCKSVYPSAPYVFVYVHRYACAMCCYCNITYVGKYNPKTVGEFTQWNNLREIALWNSSDARRLRGTDGYLFHANVKRDDKLRAFVTELYRCVSVSMCVCMREVEMIKLVRVLLN